MSLSQTYYVAASARRKLGMEAQRADHHLRLLVGHANLLDQLMLDLADAEREQEIWFNQTVRRASRAEEVEEPKHIRWADTMVEDTEFDDYESESDSDAESESAEDDMITTPAPLTSAPTQPRIITTEITVDNEESDDEYEDDEYDDEHALVRVASQQTPELVLDDDSDDDSQPPSPPQPTLEYAEKGFFSSTASSLLEPDKGMDHYFTERSSPLVASY